MYQHLHLFTLPVSHLPNPSALNLFPMNPHLHLFCTNPLHAHLYLSALITLELSHNQLDVLPPEIGFLTRLETLNCSSNRITALPSLEQLTELKMLDLSQNNLTTFPRLSSGDRGRGGGRGGGGREGGGNLTHLVLAYNRIPNIDIDTLVAHKVS